MSSKISAQQASAHTPTAPLAGTTNVVDSWPVLGFVGQMVFDIPMPLPTVDGRPDTYFLDTNLGGIEVRDAGEFYCIRWRVDPDNVFWSMGDNWTPPTLVNKRHVSYVRPPLAR